MNEVTSRTYRVNAARHHASGDIKKLWRTDLRVESLEGKTLLSAGLVNHQVGSHAVSTTAVAHAAAEFSGTLTGIYSNVHIPFAGYVVKLLDFRNAERSRFDTFARL